LGSTSPASCAGAALLPVIVSCGAMATAFTFGAMFGRHGRRFVQKSAPFDRGKSPRRCVTLA
jgi:amino acid permease